MCKKQHRPHGGQLSISHMLSLMTAAKNAKPQGAAVVFLFLSLVGGLLWPMTLTWHLYYFLLLSHHVMADVMTALAGLTTNLCCEEEHL